MDNREELKEIISTDSILERDGGYILASGRHSPYYIDLKLTTLSNPRALFLASRIILEKIQLDGPVDAIGGLTSGADPLIIGVSQEALHQGMHLPAFFVRDQQKSHGTERLIEGNVKQGMNVVVVDDVVTTGKSVMNAVRPVEAQGAHVVRVFILVDREEGGVPYLRGEGYSVEPIFKVSELRRSR